MLAVGGGRQYVPQYRSGAYALILTLYRNAQVLNFLFFSALVCWGFFCLRAFWNEILPCVTFRIACFASHFLYFDDISLNV